MDHSIGVNGMYSNVSPVAILLEGREWYRNATCTGIYDPFGPELDYCDATICRRADPLRKSIKQLLGEPNVESFPQANTSRRLGSTGP